MEARERELHGGAKKDSKHRHRVGDLMLGFVSFVFEFGILNSFLDFVFLDAPKLAKVVGISVVISLWLRFWRLLATGAERSRSLGQGRKGSRAKG